MNPEVIQINENTWRIEDGMVRFFLLAGKKKALLIDSGMTVCNAREIAGELTDLPVELINTHADIDHVGSNAQFEAPYMNPAELSNYHNTQHKSGEITPVWDGDEIDLGDRPLKIIAIPGHTPGSIAILDINARMLFSGDPIQDGGIFMFGIQRDFTAYRHSLLRLKKMEQEFDQIYPSHGSCPVGKEMIDALIAGASKVMDGEITAYPGDFHGVSLKIYDVKVAKFLGDAE